MKGSSVSDGGNLCPLWLLRIATNEIAAFCIDNSLRAMAFFFGVPKWAEAGFRFMAMKKLYL